MDGNSHRRTLLIGDRRRCLELADDRADHIFRCPARRVFHLAGGFCDILRTDVILEFAAEIVKLAADLCCLAGLERKIGLVSNEIV
jgi:hypothetical protein